MFGSTVLEVAMGMALVFLFVSILCSAICEALAGLLAWRSETLGQGVEKLLQDPALAAKVRDNQLVKALAPKDGTFPSYLPSKTFALALVDEISRGAQPTPEEEAPPPSITAAGERAGFVAVAKPYDPLAALRASIPKAGPLAALLADRAITDIDKAKAVIAHWFDNGMDRASGWYKRRTRLTLTIVAVAVSVGLNIDAIHIGESLARDGTLRAAIVAASQRTAVVVDNPSDLKPAPKLPEETPITRAVAIDRELDSLHLPIGWASFKARNARWQDSLAGWLLTAIAASLGAPFWFDLLNKLVNLRNAGKPPEKADAGGTPPPKSA